jgi:hypothetical protein
MYVPFEHSTRWRARSRALPRYESQYSYLLAAKVHHGDQDAVVGKQSEATYTSVALIFD